MHDSAGTGGSGTTEITLAQQVFQAQVQILYK